HFSRHFIRPQTRHISDNFYKKTKGSQHVTFLSFPHVSTFHDISFNTKHDIFLTTFRRKQKPVNMLHFCHFRMSALFTTFHLTPNTTYFCQLLEENKSQSTCYIFVISACQHFSRYFI